MSTGPKQKPYSESRDAMRDAAKSAIRILWGLLAIVLVVGIFFFTR